MAPSRDSYCQKPLCLIPEITLPGASPTSHLSQGFSLQKRLKPESEAQHTRGLEGHFQPHFTDEDTKARIG